MVVMTALVASTVFSTAASAGTTGGPRHEEENGYYLFNGRELTRATHGRPEEVLAKEWQIWLYRRGASASGRGYWGVISGRSVAAVRAELRNSQDFERQWERWCGCPWGDDTNFNSLGPIAIVDAPLHPTASTLLDYGERLAKLRKIIGQISAITGPGREPNPFASVGAVFKQYTENLKDAQGKLRRLRRLLDDTAGVSLRDSVVELDQLIRRGEEDQVRVQRAIDVAYHRQPPRLDGAWTSGGFRGADGTVVHQAIAATETGRVVVTLTAGAGQATQITRTYSFDAARMAIDQIQIHEDRSGWLVTLRVPDRQITDTVVGPESNVTAHISTIDLMFSSESSAREAAEALTTLSRSLNQR